MILGSFVRLGSHLRIDVAMHQIGSGALVAAERLIAEPPKGSGYRGRRAGAQAPAGAADVLALPHLRSVEYQVARQRLQLPP